MALNTIEIVLTLEGTSTIDVTNVIVSQGEVNARIFAITRPVGYEDVDGWTCICKLRNSQGLIYNYTVPADNELSISDNVLTSGKLLMQFELIKDTVTIQDNTVFSLDIKSNIVHSMDTVDDDLIADFVAHMQNTGIHFELPDKTGNAGKVLAVNTTEDGIEWVIMSGGSGSATWGFIGGTITNQTDLMNLLNQKANIVHTHVEADVTDLDKYTQAQVDTLLGGKANTVHTHTISDVTNLQTSLDGKADIAHTHAISDVTNLQTSLDAKVDKTTTVNSQPLSSNVSLDTDDIPEGITNKFLTGNEFQKTTDTMDNITDGTTYVKTENNYTDGEKTKLAGIEANAQVNTVTSVNTKTGDVVIDKTDIGLSNVQNVDQTNASNLTTGTVAFGLLPVGTTSTTVSQGDHTHMEYAENAVDETITGNWEFTGNADIFSRQITSKPDTGDEYIRLLRVKISGTNVYARSNARYNLSHTGTYLKYGRIYMYFYKISGNSSLHATSFVNIINDSGSGNDFSAGDVVYQNWIPDSGNIGFTDLYVKVREYAKVHYNLMYAFGENGVTITIDPDNGTRIASIPTTGATDTFEGISVTAEASVDATIKTITMT